MHQWWLVTDHVRAQTDELSLNDQMWSLLTLDRPQLCIHDHYQGITPEVAYYYVISSLNNIHRILCYLDTNDKSY